MATQPDTPRRSDVVRCEFCGEDYSVTYRKCPFCDDMAARPTPRPTPHTGKGGKRQVNAPRGGAPIEPVRIIGYALGIILIVAAIYIVYTMLAPLFAGREPASSSVVVSSSTSASASVSQSQPDVSISTPDVSVPDPSVSTSTPDVITPVVKTTAIALSTTDFTLKPNETHKIVATLTPANSDEAAVWTSSDPSIAAVGADGSVTNVNTGTTQKVATITVTSGSVSAQCIVRCKPGSTGTAPSTPSTPSTPSAPSAKPVASGTVGTVTGTTSGLLIRTGPGRNYEAQDTATNGAQVTILEQTADGWYKISYVGNGGRTATGYASADYIQIN